MYALLYNVVSCNLAVSYCYSNNKLDLTWIELDCACADRASAEWAYGVLVAARSRDQRERPGGGPARRRVATQRDRNDSATRHHRQATTRRQTRRHLDAAGARRRRQCTWLWGKHRSRLRHHSQGIPYMTSFHGTPVLHYEHRVATGRRQCSHRQLSILIWPTNAVISWLTNPRLSRHL